MGSSCEVLIGQRWIEGKWELMQANSLLFLHPRNSINLQQLQQIPSVRQARPGQLFPRPTVNPPLSRQLPPSPFSTTNPKPHPPPPHNSHHLRFLNPLRRHLKLPVPLSAHPPSEAHDVHPDEVGNGNAPNHLIASVAAKWLPLNINMDTCNYLQYCSFLLLTAREALRNQQVHVACV